MTQLVMHTSNYKSCPSRQLGATPLNLLGRRSATDHDFSGHCENEHGVGVEIEECSSNNESQILFARIDHVLDSPTIERRHAAVLSSSEPLI